MPKKSKMKVPERPKEHELAPNWRCFRCGAAFSKPDSKFVRAQSPLYKSNMGFTHICRRCLDDLYDHYHRSFKMRGDRGDAAMSAMRRVCEKLDVYWCTPLWESVSKSTDAAASIAMAYLRRVHMRQYSEKSYDTTHDEEEDICYAEMRDLREALERKDKELELAHQDVEKLHRQLKRRGGADFDDNISARPFSKDDAPPPTVKQVEFWGRGLDNWVYHEASRLFDNWSGALDPSVDLEDPAIRALVKKICTTEIMINMAVAKGDASDIAKLQESHMKLISNASLKPSQRKEEAAKTDLSGTPLGVLAKIHEGVKPIQDVEPELQDIDALRRTHFAMFLGGLAKMFRMKNMYAEMFDAEFARFTAKPPDRSARDDETGESQALVTKMFGGDPDG